MKNSICFILIMLINFHSYSQKEIIKNGQKINKLDKKNQKQGSWFFFDKYGDLALSCYYQNDSLVKPLVFFNKNDSIFVRYPMRNREEIFLLKYSENWLIGTIINKKSDSTSVEILGTYKKIGKDKFDIVEDSLVTNSPIILKEAKYWSNKEIEPLYMFDIKEFSNFQYKLFNEINIVFNKRMHIEIVLTASGIIDSVQFPGLKNNLSQYEVQELSYYYSQMQRWQPFFSKNKTQKHTVVFNSGLKIN